MEEQDKNNQDGQEQNPQFQNDPAAPPINQQLDQVNLLQMKLNQLKANFQGVQGMLNQQYKKHYQNNTHEDDD